MSLPIAILAGGLATRLIPLSTKIPKSLIPVAGRPFIKWQLELLSKAGISSVVLCLGHKAAEIMEYVGSGDEFGMRIQYSVEDSPLGTGGALKKAESLLGNTFGVLYGDSYLPIAYNEIFEAYARFQKLGLMTVFANRDKYEKSNVLLGENGTVLYSKRNPIPEMHFIDYGFSVLSRESLKYVPSSGFYDLADVLERLSKENQLGVFEVRNRFYQVGSFEGIVELEQFLKGDPN